VETFDLSVGLRAAGSDEATLDRALLEQLLYAPVFSVDECVVGEQPFRLDAVCGVEGEAAFDEGGDRDGSFVAMEFAVGEPGVISDE
jgi:hypothetical protein